MTVALTETETEYTVECVKHVFASHVVLQFNLTNTLNDQKLENVRVVLEGGDQEFEEGEVITVPCPELAFGKPSIAYVAMPLDPNLGWVILRC